MSTRTNPARGALAALVAIAAGLALAGCSLVNNVPGAQTDEGTVTDVFTIKVGDCLNDASAGDEVSNVPTVPCSGAHDSEAYHSFNLGQNDAYQGEEAIKNLAAEGCYTAFGDFVGIPYEDSALELSFYYPTSSSWDSGDREVLCIVYDPAGKVTGSLKGEAR